jgi:MFS family permease
MTMARNQKFIILAVALGTILNPLNTTMITVALPAIQKDFELSSTHISWLIASYFIISAIFTPLIGKLSDFYGRKSIFLMGLVFVVASSILAPFASGLLMTSRFIGNILASSIYGVVFATGMNASNLNTMAIVLVVVAIVLVPGMLYVTAHENKNNS